MQHTIQELYEKALNAKTAEQLHELSSQIGDLYCDIRTQRQSINPDLPFDVKHALDVELESLEAQAAEYETQVFTWAEEADAEELIDRAMREEAGQLHSYDSQRAATHYGINGQ